MVAKYFYLIKKHVETLLFIILFTSCIGISMSYAEYDTLPDSGGMDVISSGGMDTISSGEMDVLSGGNNASKTSNQVLISGNGVLTLEEGSTYSGEIKNGVPDGKGKLTMVDGTQYDGEWKNGVPSGYGTIATPNGFKYEGEWKDGNPYRNGKVVLSDGSLSSVTWNNQNEKQNSFTIDDTSGGMDVISSGGMDVLPSSKMDVLSDGEKDTLPASGVKLSLSNNPIQKNGNTFLPLRDISKALDAKLQWNTKTQTITLSKGKQTAQFIIGSRVSKLNGKSKTIDLAPFLKNNTTYVPVRAVAEALGQNVSFDKDSGNIKLGKYYVELKKTSSNSNTQSAKTNNKGTSSSSGKAKSNAYTSQWLMKNYFNSYYYNSRPWTSVRSYMPF